MAKQVAEVVESLPPAAVSRGGGGGGAGLCLPVCALKHIARTLGSAHNRQTPLESKEMHSSMQTHWEAQW